MSYSCYLHGWHNYYQMCPGCVTTTTSDSTTFKIDPNKIIPHGEQVAIYKAKNEKLKGRIKILELQIERKNEAYRQLSIAYNLLEDAERY